MHSHGLGRAHSHSHAPPDADRGRMRGIIALGASAGLVPCPSALVVLLGAVAQHQIALGLVLIVAFSAGLAMTLVVLGVAVVTAGHVLRRLPVPPRLVAFVPTASAAVIVGVGCVLAVQAVPQLA